MGLTATSAAAAILERIHGLPCRLIGHRLDPYLSVGHNAQGRTIYVNECKRCGYQDTEWVLGRWKDSAPHLSDK